MRRITSFFFVTMLSVGLLAAKDFWKEKPYTQWTQEEARKIVFDSPWARLVRIHSLSAGALPAPATPDVGGTISTTGGVGPGVSGGQPDTVTGATGGPGNPAAETIYNIWWTSARTFREGFARLQQLRGAMTAEQAKEFVDRRSSDYVIGLRGENMDAFEELSEDMLRSVTYLRPKRLKRKIAPSRVDIQRSPDGRSISTILFSFPRTLDGQPVIASDEKGVDFACEIKQHSISASFNLRDMVMASEFDL